MNMITVKNVSKQFGEIEVLKEISLKIKKGEIVSIIGPSGSGKSTLLRCFNDLEKIGKGEIEIGEKENKNPIELGMVFQNFNLFPHKTVLENIIEAPIVVNKIKKQEAIELGEELLDKVGLLEKKDAYPSQISGGQKQRVAIARALAMKPHIMLFDEPTSALDPELVKEVLHVISDLAKENMTMVIVTHEIAFAKKISHKIIFMDEGKILENTTPEELFLSPKNPRIKSFLQKIL